ncbi:hypothetical protein TRVL_02807 [Trypanosoma vivax]|uniref:Uncharacterized protein n=1 Tax=Trypanosoma vivax (strain Y486) TaxID=1055687 RepID=G0TT33_TRYVY|nr:hypothetical protein TRVL_02807 [Trypanosoma vivax]CCC47114.1 hypothetical protein TVY486_0303010 [Trypanosoma vivax Y486]
MLWSLLSCGLFSLYPQSHPACIFFLPTVSHSATTYKGIKVALVVPELTTTLPVGRSRQTVSVELLFPGALKGIRRAGRGERGRVGLRTPFLSVVSVVFQLVCGVFIPFAQMIKLDPHHRTRVLPIEEFLLRLRKCRPTSNSTSRTHSGDGIMVDALTSGVPSSLCAAESPSFTLEPSQYNFIDFSGAPPSGSAPVGRYFPMLPSIDSEVPQPRSEMCSLQVGYASTGINTVGVVFTENCLLGGRGHFHVPAEAAETESLEARAYECGDNDLGLPNLVNTVSGRKRRRGTE